MKRGTSVEIVSCFTRSEEKRKAFAAKYGCKAASSYDEIVARVVVDASGPVILMWGAHTAEPTPRRLPGLCPAR